MTVPMHEKVPAIPVEVAAGIARDIVSRALRGDFDNEAGFTKWGQVDAAFEKEMQAASDGKMMAWDHQLQPSYERKLRKIQAAFRRWPEPARSECCDILANG